MRHRPTLSGARRRLTAACFISCWIGLAGCTEERSPPAAPAGAPEALKTTMLEAGAKIVQTSRPPGQLDVYLVGFHPMKEHPGHQMEAHHFCKQVNEEFMQCALYDGNTDDANLTGLEYIISERLFETLPAEERQYWHPHNGEILSGQLIAPGIPAPVERELMRSKMNSYGKTWHTWATDTGAALPLGEPMLAWSFNRDGEADPALVRRRDESMGVDTAAVRAGREDLVDLANPQEGVDALKGHFSGTTWEIPGVVDKARASSPLHSQGDE